MKLADLLREGLDVDCDVGWVNERTPTPFDRLTEKHDVSDTEFLVDGGGYLIALFRHDLSSQLNDTDRNHIEKWVQTVSIRIDRCHSFWRGSPANARRWLRRFRHHYNYDRPNQALDGRTPAGRRPIWGHTVVPHA